MAITTGGLVYAEVGQLLFNNQLHPQPSMLELDDVHVEYTTLNHDSLHVVSKLQLEERDSKYNDLAIIQISFSQVML